MTAEQYAAHTSARTQKLERTDAARKRFQALGRLAKEKMNGTERAWAVQLDAKKLVGEVLDWKFHPMNVRLANNTFYEVDFLVLRSDMRIEVQETKGGHTTEKGQMKIKLCAEVLPWFLMTKITKLPKKDGGGWKIEDFSA